MPPSPFLRGRIEEGVVTLNGADRGNAVFSFSLFLPSSVEVRSEYVKLRKTLSAPSSERAKGV